MNYFLNNITFTFNMQKSNTQAQKEALEQLKKKPVSKEVSESIKEKLKYVNKPISK